MFQLDNGISPQEIFVKLFSAQYKLADEKAGKEEEEEAEDNEMVENEEDLKEVKEDAVVSSVEFRPWKALARGNAVYL